MFARLSEGYHAWSDIPSRTYLRGSIPSIVDSNAPAVRDAIAQGILVGIGEKEYVNLRDTYFKENGHLFYYDILSVTNNNIGSVKTLVNELPPVYSSTTVVKGDKFLVASNPSSTSPVANIGDHILVYLGDNFWKVYLVELPRQIHIDEWGIMVNIGQGYPLYVSTQGNLIFNPQNMFSPGVTFTLSSGGNLVASGVYQNNFSLNKQGNLIFTP